MNKYLALKITALAGLINAIWMSILHVRYDKFGSVCAVSEKISCDVLTYKQYSEWWGVPTPVYGIFAFLVLFILSYRGWKNIGDRKREDTYIWILACLALLVAIRMAYVSFFILNKLCIFCFFFYIVITVFWLFSTKIIKTHNEKISTLAIREITSFYKYLGVWFTTVAFVCAISFAHVAFQKNATLSTEHVEIRGDEVKTTGNPSAKITIVIFSDFQCPHCKFAADILRLIEHKYASKIKITYKFFPLDPSCNDGAPYGQHLMACDAARAALCAGQQGDFWRYHDYLFANQNSLHEKKFFEIAEEENLDMGKFSDCYNSDAAVEGVKKDAKEGESIKISATPTLFFNGKKYEGRISEEDISKMIDSL